MNQRTKKIVAREILIAFATALVIGLALLIIQWRISLIESRAFDIQRTLSAYQQFNKRLRTFINEVAATDASKEESIILVDEWIAREKTKDKRFLKSESDYHGELNILYNTDIYLYSSWWMQAIIIVVLSIVYPVRFIVLILIWAIHVYYKSE